MPSLRMSNYCVAITATRVIARHFQAMMDAVLPELPGAAGAIPASRSSFYYGVPHCLSELVE